MAEIAVDLSREEKPQRSTSAWEQQDDSFKYLVESAADGILIQQDYRIVYANPAALKQFGASSLSEIYRRSMYDFISPNDRPMMKAFLEDLFEHGGFSDPQGFRRLRLDGSLIDVVAVATKISWQGRPALLGIIRNATRTESIRITLQKEATEQDSQPLWINAQWLWETDKDHRFTFFSDDIYKLGLRTKGIVGKTRWELAGVTPDCNAMWRDHIADLEAHRPFKNFEYTFVDADGVEIPRSVSGVPIFDSKGTFKGYRGSSRDLTESRRAEKTVEHMALHDALTGLPNRAGFSRELERACSDISGESERFALLFLDLDHFKDVNDTLGHSIGDKLLIDVSIRLRGSLGARDLVARFGGDEFVILVSQNVDKGCINDLARRLTTAISEPYDIEGMRVHTNVSIGVAIFPDHGPDGERLLANADLALYEAKREGRNTWRVFNSHLQKQIHHQRSLDQALRQALDQQQFELHYQPLVSLVDYRLLGFEALIRWNRPAHGQVQPNDFIPATERNQLIVPLTEWIFLEVCQQHKSWISAGLGELNISVNVPPSLLKLQGFVDLLERCATSKNCDPSCLTIEITEGTPTDEAKLIGVLCRLREQGVTIAIDDFGKGYSSMARLKALPVDVLKIDRTFLSNATRHPSESVVLESLIKVGQSLGKKVVAEGVETPEQFGLLKRIGCDFVQGFLIEEPMMADDVPVWLQQRRSQQADQRYRV